MWRRHQVCCCTLLALGLGILVGCSCGSTVIAVFLGLGCFVGGFFILCRRK